MLKFKFQINKYYLLCHALAWGRKERSLPFKEWVNLQDRLYKKSEEAYILITGGPQWITPGEEIFAKSNNLKDLEKTCKSAQNLLKEAECSKEFKRLLRETQKYLKYIEEQWKNKRIKALGLLSEITGLKIPEKEIKVSITHPKLYNGINFPEEKIIGWGHPEEWKNYSVVYLCHELLHILTYKKFKSSELMHALIELATDNELRIRLNKKGKYFEVPTHKSLLKLEKYILPLWKKSLKEGKEKNIFELEKKLLKNKKIQGLLKYDIQIQFKVK